LITALNEHKEKEVEQFFKMGLRPKPVPASLRLRRQLRPVVGFGLVGLNGCFRIVGFAGWFG
jgi:hypothetical protein